jgi:hypothetical protein
MVAAVPAAPVTLPERQFCAARSSGVHAGDGI